VIEGKYL